MLTTTVASLPTSRAEPATALAAILRADQVSCEILRFFLENERAMDSAKGIAAWWVHRDEIAVQPSLHRLLACGAVLAHTLTSGVTLYRLTSDSELRSWLRNALSVSKDRTVDTDGRLKQENPATSASVT